MMSMRGKCEGTMTTFSQYFHLNKQQFELDFVDVPIDNGDIALFVDPYAISKRVDNWSINCHNYIVSFFQDLLNHIRSGNSEKAKYMMSELKEPNQTRFGLSSGEKPRGRGIGKEQVELLYKSLAESTAVKTGFIKDLEECELLIEGISWDKISDIATNIIRNYLIDYTQGQCHLWNIPMNLVPSGALWKDDAWSNEYVELPVCPSGSIILVPKAIVRFKMEFNQQEYYQHFVLNYLQSEHMSANSSLCRTLKNGIKKPPYKKELKEINPLSKKYLYEFTKDHPEVLEKYKQAKSDFKLAETDVGIEAQSIDYNNLMDNLSLIPSGPEHASDYHNYIIGVLTAIFHPFLINPKKEHEIHEGRKRIDIVFENAAKEGFFYKLPNNKKVPSGYIMVECKNYSRDIANPELDQIAGRFSINRGQFGLIVCRSFDDKQLFIQRCRDTANDGRGFIIVLDDKDIVQLLTLKKQNKIKDINNFFENRYQELVM